MIPVARLAADYGPFVQYLGSNVLIFLYKIQNLESPEG